MTLKVLGAILIFVFPTRWYAKQIGKFKVFFPLLEQITGALTITKMDYTLSLRAKVISTEVLDYLIRLYWRYFFVVGVIRAGVKLGVA